MEKSEKENSKVKVDMEENVTKPEDAMASEAAPKEGESTENTEVVLKAEIEGLKAALNSANDKHLRAVAEMENIKKRASANLVTSELEIKVRIVSQFLGTLESFDRAQAIEDKTGKSYAEGIEMIGKQLVEIMKNLGVKKIDEKVKFDPSLHMSIATDSIDDVDDEMILEVLQPGYELDGRVIKTAMVKVNQKS